MDGVLADEAKDVRLLDRSSVMRIFDRILHLARTSGGNMQPLHGAMAGSFRLRIGDYPVLFTLDNQTMTIFGVRHRREAYR